MWFNKTDIIKHDTIQLNDLHGYVLPHAGTKHTGHILSHTMRYIPRKKFTYILIIYLPANNKPNVGNDYHEYYVPYNTLKQFFPEEDGYVYIGYNILGTKPIIENLNKRNSIYVISADFSHYLPMQEAVDKENKAAHALMHKVLDLDSLNVVDDIRSFKKMYELLPNVQLQWVGRTRSSGTSAVGYLSFLIRDKPKLTKIPDAFFVTAYDSNMNQRECLGNVKKWSIGSERSLKNKVIYNARTTSRLTNGIDLDVPVTHYTITYLYKDPSKNFIRGHHAILKDALYLPDVFLENTYNNGVWIEHKDTTWPLSNKFSLIHTFSKLQDKANVQIPASTYQLFTSTVLHCKIRTNHRTRKKR
jgi:hypothetical protein